MKKVLLVIGLVVVLIGGTIYADKAVRLLKSRSVKVDVSNDVACAPEPDVTFEDLDGKDVPLGQYKGKVVFVNFWATWCEACQGEIPWLIEMQQEYSSKGFTILGVDVDAEGRSALASYAAKERFSVGGRELPINYPLLLGNDSVADKFSIFGYPTSFLISRDGKVLKKIQGIVSNKEIRSVIESQL